MTFSTAGSRNFSFTKKKNDAYVICRDDTGSILNYVQPGIEIIRQLFAGVGHIVVYDIREVAVGETIQVSSSGISLHVIVCAME